MKILLMVCSFPPELSPGHLEFELSQAFAADGQKVDVVTAFPRRYLLRTPIKPKGVLIYKEKFGKVRVIRMGPEFADRDNMLSRGSEYFFGLILYSLGGLLSTKNDIILCSSPPLTVGLAGWFLARLRRIPFIVRIGDIHPQALIDLGLVKSGKVIFILNILEQLLYRKADHIIVLSDKYKKDLISKGTQPEKVSVISNWVDPEEIIRLEKTNTFRTDMNLSDKFLVTYAGVMSWPQDLLTIVESASILSQFPNIRFVLAGDGAQRKALESKAVALGLKNLTFLPLQPRDRYVNIIQSSDACLVSLKKDFKSPAVPTKLLDIMACGRPVIANVPLNGDVAKIMVDAKCGYSVEPQNPKALSDAILRLSENKDRGIMGRNAKQYFNNHYSLQSCKREYEKIFFDKIAD